MANKIVLNMKKKVERIDGAINTAYRLLNGDTINLGGFIGKIKAPADSQQFYLNRISELQDEREKLLIRISWYS